MPTHASSHATQHAAPRVEPAWRVTLKGWFIEQTMPLPAYDGARGTPLRLAKHFSQDRAFLSRWRWEVAKGPATGDMAFLFTAALGPPPAFQTSVAPQAPPSSLLSAQPLTMSSPGGPTSRSGLGEQG